MTHLIHAQTLTVHLFTSRQVTSAKITPLGSDATYTLCPSCKQQALRAPIHLHLAANGLQIDRGETLQSLALSGSFRIQDESPNPSTRDATVSGALRITREKDSLRVLLDLPSERYVVAALNGEAAPDEPLASLKAMAVAIRTFALANAHRHAAEGFGLCDDTHCQSLRLAPARLEVEQAVLETAGETLWFPANQSHAVRAAVYYAQNCGGATEDVSSVWPDIHAPYLTAHPDPYCVRRGRATWHADIPLDRLAALARAEGWKTPASIASVKIAKRTPSGRALLLEITGYGPPAHLSASSLRFAVDRALGWNTMRSDAYELRVAGGALHVEGHGFGHGVGLCQAGAFEMAAEGKSYRDILAFYFAGTSVGLTPTDTGWSTTEAGGWTLRSVTPSSSLKQAGDAAWARARQLFPPHTPASQPLQPIAFAAPTTELFRQMSGEPGWTLAATRGDRIVLQPESVLRTHAAVDSTLLHEFLHVLIEAEAAPNTPLWLREGLAEALAAPATSAMNARQTMPNPADLDARLTHPATQADSQRAHAAAEALVRSLIAHYSLPTVRGWLRTSVPTAVL